MSEQKINKLESRKKALEEELKRIQSGIDHSIDEVREDVSDTIDPKKIIQKNPLQTFGAAVFVGYLLGKGNKNGSGSSSSHSKGVGTVIGNEIKHQITQRAMSLFMDFLDSRIDEIRNKDSR